VETGGIGSPFDAVTFMRCNVSTTNHRGVRAHAFPSDSPNEDEMTEASSNAASAGQFRVPA
jgi:hypothetical protein